MIGTSGNDRLTGGPGDDLLQGLAGNDVLIGGGGADRTEGGAGNDAHYVDNARDVVNERSGEGDDKVFASTGYVLATGAEIEALFAAAGTAAIHLTGNELAQSIYGNAGANVLRGGAGNDYLAGLDGIDTLDGGAGADNLRGGTGNDRYWVDDAADRVFEDAVGGDDTVFATTSYRLGAGVAVEALRAADPASTVSIALTGNELAQSIYGNAGANVLRGGGGNDYLAGLDGADTLDGGAGADNLRGGAGSDRYWVDNAADRVFEDAGDGDDTVFATTSYRLGAGVAVEALRAADPASTVSIAVTGNELAQSIYGNAGANVLRGGGGNDYLAGLDGADTLDGGAGADNLRGGAGNDRYWIDNTADRVFEDTGGGDDTVFATTSYTLAAGVAVEALRAADPASTVSIHLTGNELAQSIYGNAGANLLRGGGGNDYLAGLDGADTLDGGAGADNLRGGAGNDSYRIDSASDRIFEEAAGGTDGVLAGVSYRLGAHLETLSAADPASATAIDLTGNDLANVIRGNAGIGIIDGKGGSDTLRGLGGSDLFAFTTALGSSNVDAIDDFSVTDDLIMLGGAAGQPFAALASGLLSAGAFVRGTAALQPDDVILYDAAGGGLFYDADGSGGAAAVRFATLAPNLTLSAQDFFVSGPANRAPVVTSAASATVAENSAASAIVYQAAATDADGDRVTFALAGADAGRFTIDAAGAVRLKAPADFETKSSYAFTLIATDSGPNGATRQVTLAVTDVAERLPPYTVTDTEHNDIRSTAQPLDRARLAVTDNPNLPDPSLPSATIKGNVAAGGDQDHFSLQLKAGELLVLDVDGTTTLDSELLVFDPAGNRIASNDDPGSFDPGSTAHAGLSHNMDSAIRLRAPTDGTYTFAIRSFIEETGNTTSGAYTLNVSVGPPAARAQIDEENIQAMLAGPTWSTLTLTYGFPTNGSQYGGDGSAEIEAGMRALNATQQEAVRSIAVQIAQVTNLTLSYVTANPGSAQLRYALSDEPPTAHAYEPGPGDGGDSWYNSAGYINPVVGNYEWLTFVHETGHALGLKHSHEAPALSPDRDSMEYTLMTYRSYIGAAVDDGGGYTNETWGYAQTPMMYDIAALQRLYGADFSSNSGNSVYSWSPGTGALMINGAAQWTPGGNRVFMTLWDGGGVDTIDVSNYSSRDYGISIDLRPGEWTTLSSTQLANLGDSRKAIGNVAMALQYNDDPRSLIENVTGSPWGDRIVANDTQNRLAGGAGPDIFDFRSVSASDMGQPDTLADFDVSADRIDLSRIDAVAATSADNPFAFIGSGAFSGRAGELRLGVDNGVTHVFGDVDGDAVADLHIIVMAVNLTSDDFLL